MIAVGALSSSLGYALLLRIDAAPGYAAVLLPTMLLLGVGFALGFPTLNIQATNGVADHEQGLASGLVQTSFQVGGAIGLAIVTRDRDRARPAARPTPARARRLPDRARRRGRRRRGGLADRAVRARPAERAGTADRRVLMATSRAATHRHVSAARTSKMPVGPVAARPPDEKLHACSHRRSLS